MNFWEIICVVVGICGMMSIHFHLEGKADKGFVIYALLVIFHEFLSAALILLPLYFVYWRV